MMIRRITRTLIIFAVLVAAYQAYVLLAVPLMEPPLAVRDGRRATREERDRAAQAVTKYQLLLSNYFPKDHWSQTQPPRVIANATEQAMLVFDDWKRRTVQTDGKNAVAVDVERFALLVFPTPPREGITPPRDAIVLEAAQGARLQFDDFRPELGKIGQITRGTFPGRITIRSDMHEPGPEDDLLVETANLEMNTKLLYSNSPVQFRMGANVGGGRELEIRFLADEHVKPSESGLRIAGIDSLEIRREVRFRLELETDRLLPGDDKEVSPTNSPPGTAMPVDISCSGPFTFDFVRYVASLDRDVELRQTNTSGPSDQVFCSQLDIHFAPRSLPDEEPRPVVVDAGKRQQRDLGRLAPAAIVAAGHPAIVTSPARNAQARGDRIHVMLQEQRVRVSGGREAMLVYGPNVLRAPVIEYQHPPQGAATAIGRFRATGPGTLHYVLDPAKPDQFFQAIWQTSIDLGREKGQPVLTLDGRPQLALSSAGTLTADRIAVYLRELEGSTAAVGLAVGGGDGDKKLQVVPDRMAATGRVEIQSMQLAGSTDELLATFRMQPDADESSADASAGGEKGGLLTSPTLQGDAEQSYYIESDNMQLEIRMKDQAAMPTTVTCAGDVVFREVPRVSTDQQPLEIRGAQLTVDRLESSAPYVTLHGAAPGETAGAKKVQLTGRGINVFTDKVELDARENRLWSDGPGKATLLVTRDFEGRASATPFPLDVTWQGGLQFDGRTMSFERQVSVAGADDTLGCDRLLARLSAPIDFGKGVDQRAIDLAEIECQDNVTINHLSRDALGVTSHERMELARLTLNQRTGAISGDGPGVIRSTRFGGGLNALVGGQNGVQSTAGGNKLHFLRVDFDGGLEGNMHLRELAFKTRVRTIYGPVDAWEQELNASRPETLPSETMTLTCDEMRISEDPIAARAMPRPAAGAAAPLGPVQVQAKHNVRIDGQVPGQGPFSAHAARASYEQAKDKLILEGDGRTPATLRRPGQQGSPPAARKITYVRSTNQITVDGIQYLEITPGDIENARRPAPIR